MTKYDQDWYEAIVIANSILGDSFPLGDSVVYRRISSKRKFEVFNLRDATKILSGDDATTQLRASRDSYGEVRRAKDQGYLNWKYQGRQE